MKFLHLGDLHIGRSLGDFDLIPDQKYILEQIIGIAKEHSVDAFLLAGDLYDKAIPSESAVRLFDWFLRQLVEEGFGVYAISGNHDSDERLNFGSQMFASHGVYLTAKYDGTLFCHKAVDAYGEINIYLLPFVKASRVRQCFPDETIPDYDAAVRAVLRHADIDPKARNLIVSHQFVAGRHADPALGGSESLAVHQVGLVEKIGIDCFDAFDYAALGHIHSGQKMDREEVRYCGSPLKYSLSEVNNAKSVPIVTLKEKGEVEIALIGLKPLRDLRHIKGTMAQLLSRERVCDTDDYIYATLTDEDPILDAMSVFQQIYPRTIRIDYDNAHTRQMVEIDVFEQTGQRAFPEVLGDFYQMMFGCEISKEELELMCTVAREAGVMHETDEIAD